MCALNSSTRLQVDNLRNQLDNVASEVVKFTQMLANLQAEEVSKDEAKERRSALTREMDAIDFLIKLRIAKVGYNIEN